MKIESDSEKGKDLMHTTGATGVPLCLIMNNNEIIKHKIGYN